MTIGFDFIRGEINFPPGGFERWRDAKLVPSKFDSLTLFPDSQSVPTRKVKDLISTLASDDEQLDISESGDVVTLRGQLPHDDGHVLAFQLAAAFALSEEFEAQGELVMLGGVTEYDEERNIALRIDDSGFAEDPIDAEEAEDMRLKDEDDDFDFEDEDDDLDADDDDFEADDTEADAEEEVAKDED